MRDLAIRSVGAVCGGLLLMAAGCSDGDSIEPRHIDAASTEIRAAVQSNAAVALELHSVLRDQPGNLIYSPLSIEAVLGMLYAGAHATTADQIGAVLDAAAKPAEFHHGLGELMKDLSGTHADRSYELAIANALFAGSLSDSSAQFTATMRDDYDAPLHGIDFSQPSAARDQINAWVSDQTHQHIPALLQEGDVSANSVMTLVDALYFRADWSTAFDARQTHDAPFTLDDGSTVNVRMMNLTKAQLRVYKSPDLTRIEMPYRGGDLAFEAWLPGLTTNLHALEASLSDPESLSDANLSEAETAVQFPRFSMRSHVNLVPVFQRLGVVDAFDGARADFSEISKQLLYVSSFVHEAWVQVDEQGTEAAAGTAATLARHASPQPIVFDHPFLFFVRDRLSGAILFTGRVANPSAP